MGFAPPQHSSLLTLDKAYRSASRAIGDYVPVNALVASRKLPEDTFIDYVNDVLLALAIETRGITRLAILTPGKDWVRYVARPTDLHGGIIRIDLEGQTRSFCNADDYLGWQYESVSDGAGIAPSYVSGTVNQWFPDSFPMIALPGESDIPETEYPPTGTPTYTHARLFGDRKGNHPLTPGIFNMRVQGYAGRDPTSDDFPNVNDLSSFFVDIFMVYGMRMLTYDTGATGPFRNGAIPYNNEAYLNSTWREILGMDNTSSGTIGLNPLGTIFHIDGLRYTVTLTGIMNYDNYDFTPAGVADPAFAFYVNHERWDPDLTPPAWVVVQSWLYVINPDYTPWQTVATPHVAPLNVAPLNTGGNTRWGYTDAPGVANGASHGLFGDERYASDRAAYIAINRRALSLPDDCDTIKWLEEIPVRTFRSNLPDNPDDDVIVHAIAHQELLMLNPTDGRKRLWPLGEGRFGWERYLHSLLSPTKTRGQQYYWRAGNQLYLAGETLDLRSATYMLLYDARPDVIPADTIFADFGNFRLDLHGASPDIITDYIMHRHHLAVGGRDSQAAQDYGSLFYGKLKDAEVKRWGEHSQQGDAPAGIEVLNPGSHLKPYFDPLGDPENDWRR